MKKTSRSKLSQARQGQRINSTSWRLMTWKNRKVNLYLLFGEPMHKVLIWWWNISHMQNRPEWEQMRANQVLKAVLGKKAPQRMIWLDEQYIGGEWRLIQGNPRSTRVLKRGRTRNEIPSEFKTPTWADWRSMVASMTLKNWWPIDRWDVGVLELKVTETSNLSLRKEIASRWSLAFT